MRKTIVSLLLLAATAAVAQADPLKVKIGAAANHGEVSFTLSTAPPQGSLADAEDLAQETFIAAYEQLTGLEFKPGSQPAAERIQTNLEHYFKS